MDKSNFKMDNSQALKFFIGNKSRGIQCLTNEFMSTSRIPEDQGRIKVGTDGAAAPGLS